VVPPPSQRPLPAASDGPTALAASAAPGAAITEAPPSRGSRWLAVAIGSAIALPILGAALATAMHRNADPSLAVAPPAAATTSLAQPTDPQTVDLIIHVSPSAAQITIDGATVSNPFHARYAKDERAHRITASADGYETKSEALSFNSDVAIDLGLDRHAPPAAATHKAAAAPPPPPPPPPRGASKRGAFGGQPAAPSSDAPAAQPPGPSAHTEVNPAGGHAPLRPIATTNPYGDP
jgi:hypothetical protein